MSNLLVVPTPGAIVTQRLALAVVKAGLSGIPFASLVWDVTAATLDFVNSREAQVFLDELGERVARLELENGKLGRPAQNAAHESLQRLMFESSEDYARELAGAVAAIEDSNEDPRLLGQVAAAIGKMNSRFRVYLGVIHRFENERHTAREIQIVEEVQPFPLGTLDETESYDVLHALECVLQKHHPSLSVSADLGALEGLGLLTLPKVRLVTPEPEPWKIIPVRLTDLGHTVLDAFTDDPEGIPVFSDLYAAPRNSFVGNAQAVDVAPEST